MKKRNRIVAIVLMVALVITFVLSIATTSYAATTKTGKLVKGQEILNKLEEYKCTMKAYENDEQPEKAIVVQTRDFANIKKNGFKAINYGLLLNYDGKKDSEKKPLLVNKKHPQKDSYKYITTKTPDEYVVTFTNSYYEGYTLFQKSEEYDAYSEGDVYYGFLYADEIEENTSVNLEGILDSKANAQYIDPEANFRMYTIKDPSEDKEIGLFFTEVSLNEKQSAKIATGG